MRNTAIFILSVLLVLIFQPATSQDELLDPQEKENLGWNIQQMPFNYQNAQVPRELWEYIKDTLRADGHSESVISDFSVLPINMQMDIMSEDKYVLAEGLNHRLIFIEGGGDVDMFNYVSGKGGFYLRMTPAFTEPNDFYLFYVSESPGKAVGGDMWGNQCGRIYNLSKNKNIFLEESGIAVTSARKHYLHLLAGTYVFAQLVDDRMYLGYIRINDSRYPQFKCKDS